jgi:hypothetical protein
MLGKLIGSINKERALVYLVAREAGYAREIARFFDVPLFIFIVLYIRLKFLVKTWICCTLQLR